MNTSVQFSKNIRYFRDYYGLNQSGLVKLLSEKDSRIRLHPSTVSAWERGLTGQPTARTLAWLARTLNDFTPFTLTGHMLLHDDMETLFNQARQGESSTQETMGKLEKQYEDMSKHLKHCLYRIQSLEEDRNRLYASIHLVKSGKESTAGLTDILATLGFEEHNGRFFNNSGEDVTDSIEQLALFIRRGTIP